MSQSPMSSAPMGGECKCDLRTKLVGDGCQFCNPELAAEYEREAEESDARAQFDQTTVKGRMA